MSDVFRHILEGYSARQRKQHSLGADLRSEFVTLLSNFRAHQEAADVAAKAFEESQQEIFTSLLTGYASAWDAYRASQVNMADDFNILGVLGLTNKEIRHSMMLAWLLDHDMRRYGTHCQGSSGFRFFLSEIGLPASYADERYIVSREVSGDNSIVDLEIACREHFLIHVEIKIWSSEGVDQTNREWNDLQERAKSLDLKTPNPAVHAFFLTPHGSRPECCHFIPISWRRIANVVKAFAEQAIPPDVRLFAAHYAKTLESFTRNISVTKEATDE